MVFLGCAGRGTGDDGGSGNDFVGGAHEGVNSGDGYGGDDGGGDGAMVVVQWWYGASKGCRKSGGVGGGESIIWL